MSTSELGSGNVTFTGGTMQFAVSSDLSSRIVNSSGPISIDTYTQPTLTFASPLGASNSGGLTKVGSGALVLPANNTFTGPVTVTAGIVSVTGSLSGPTTIVVGSTQRRPGGHLPIGATSYVTNTDTGAGGFQVGGAAGAALGYYNLSGGTVKIAGEIDVGGSSGGAGTFGELDMSGGLISLPTAASSWFLPDRGGAGEASVINLSGGTISFVNGATGYVANWAARRAATFTISGNAQFLSAGKNVNLNQSGNAANIDYLNLNGGTLQAKAFVGTGGMPW